MWFQTWPSNQIKYNLNKFLFKKNFSYLENFFCLLRVIYHQHNNMIYPVSISLYNLFSVIYYSIAFFSVLGNLLIVWVVCMNKKMRTPTNFLILNIALADIIISVFSTPFQVVLIVHFTK